MGMAKGEDEVRNELRLIVFFPTEVTVSRYRALTHYILTMDSNFASDGGPNSKSPLGARDIIAPAYRAMKRGLRFKQ
jgi:hypothetical protein